MARITFETAIDLQEQGLWIGSYDVAAAIQSEDGTWWVDDVSLDTFRGGKPARVVIDSELCYRSPFFARLRALIIEELMRDVNGRIRDALNAEEDLLAEDGGGCHEFHLAYEELAA